MFGEWFEAHPTIRQYVTVSIASASTANDPKFQRKRSNIHKQLISRLSSFHTFVEQEKIRKHKKLQTASLMCVKKVGPLVFSDSEQRMNVRKTVFLSRCLQSRKVQKTSNELMEAIVLLEEISQLIENLKNPAFVPDFRTLEISDSYFVFPRSNEATESLKFEIQALKRQLKLRYREIEKYKPPASFSSFNEVMRQVIATSKKEMDPSLSYAPPVPYEVDLSRYIWVYDETHRVSTLFDKAIDTVMDKKDAASLQDVVEMCYNFIPNGDSRPIDEQSLGLVALFRVFFDRLYERYSTNILSLDSVEDACVMDKLASRPLEWFRLPAHVVQEFKDTRMSMRDCIRNDPGLWESVNTLNQVMFMTCPIDMLYAVHMSLMLMHNVGVSRESCGNSSDEDAPKLMCFDDLFSVLVGVGVVSDISGFSKLSGFLQTFAPESCLSNPLEYAQTAISAFASHCRLLEKSL